MKYRVIQATTISDLEKYVTELMEHAGFIPVGSFKTTGRIHSQGTNYYQAMYKPVIETESKSK